MFDVDSASPRPSTQQAPYPHRAEARLNENITDSTQLIADDSPISLLDARGQSPQQESIPLGTFLSTRPLPPIEDQRTADSSNYAEPSAVNNMPENMPLAELSQPGIEITPHERSLPHSALGRVGFQTPPHHTSANSSESSLSPSERPPPRVRWDASLPARASSNPTVPRWDTPHPEAPPPTVPNPQNVTPLWNSNPPSLRSFPNAPLYYSNQSTPWYYTPHPLPLNPLTPLYSVPNVTPNVTFPGPSIDETSSSRIHPTPSGVDISANANHASYTGGSGYAPEPLHNLNRPFNTSLTLEESTPRSFPYIYTPGTPFNAPRSLEEFNSERRQQAGNDNGRGSGPQVGNDNGGGQRSSGGLASAAPPQHSIHDRHHERFHLVDGNIEFRVNNMLFKVHFHFFWHARALYALGPIVPLGQGLFVDLTRFGFSPSEFGLLLAIIYPRKPGTLEIQGVEEWFSVLKVASALGMDDIRTLAIDQILKIGSPPDHITLVREYDVPFQRLISAFRELCTRSQPLTEEETKKLGVENLFKLDRMKHELQNNITQYLDFAKVDQMLLRFVSGSG